MAYQRLETAPRELSARILGKCAKHILVSVQQQDVGDDSAIYGRAEIASSCACVFVLAISIKSRSLSRTEAARRGTASSSRARWRTTSSGAPVVG